MEKYTHKHMVLSSFLPFLSSLSLSENGYILAFFYWQGERRVGRLSLFRKTELSWMAYT
jgi:hypothetical protein